MRLRRLDLVRYGRFTDRSLDFGPARPGEPDLHIVYGPNEAGKSTTLSAFLDLLFGIPKNSGYGFLHSYATMRVGATLETDAGALELIRIKRPQASLLDRMEQPIPEAALQGGLGGVDRDGYRTMFLLDDDTLEAGGESILASKGDLGQLLFAASAGLADLGVRLDNARSEADRFYRYKARSGELAELKVRLQELKAERERIDIAASRHVQLVEARASAEKRYEQAMGERGALLARIADISRRLAALPRLAELRTLRDRLAPLAALPEAPEGWSDELPRLRDAEIRLQAECGGAAAEVERLRAAAAATAIDQAAIEASVTFMALSDLAARSRTADEDLPERRQALGILDRTMAALVVELGAGQGTEPSRLILTAAAEARIVSLMESRSGIEARLAATGHELARAEAGLEEAGQGLTALGIAAAAGDGESAFAALAATLAAIQADDPGARLRQVVRAEAQAAAALASRLAGLAPWRGDAALLAGAPAPPRAIVARWSADLRDAEAACTGRRDEVERLTAERARRVAERDALAASGVGDAASAARLRAGRDAAWAAHRRTLDAATADAFEAAMRRDDLAIEARLGQAEGRARLDGLERELAVIEADLGRANQRAVEAEAARAKLQDEIAASIQAFLPDGAELPLWRIEDWIEARGEALKAAEAAATARRDLDEAEAAALGARERLAKACAGAGVAVAAGGGLDDALAIAREAAGRFERMSAARRIHAERRLTVEERRREAEAALRADTEWRKAWEAACRSTWLGDADVTLEPAEMRGALRTLDRLRAAHAERVSLGDRIAKMERDQAEFAAAIGGLAKRLGLEDDKNAAGQAETIARRIEAAKSAAERKREALAALDLAAGRQRSLEAQRAELELRKAAVTRHFGVATLAEAEACMQQAARRAEWSAQASRIETELAAALGMSPSEAEEALAGVDAAGLEAELPVLEAKARDLDGLTRELFAEAQRARDALDAIGGDGAVARIEEERRTILIEVEEGARRYLRRKLGVTAADQAMRLYRDRHRSSMMASASAAFALVTRQAYSGLRTQAERDGEKLVAVAADGASKLASELSKGTRFQLYLALRAAGHAELARSRTPAPFVADDILETFDDFRAEEAFRLFAGMAGSGQVIYLTHHRHLCEIAKQVCPTVKVHRLGAGS